MVTEVYGWERLIGLPNRVSHALSCQGGELYMLLLQYIIVHTAILVSVWRKIFYIEIMRTMKHAHVTAAPFSSVGGSVLVLKYKMMPSLYCVKKFKV